MGRLTPDHLLNASCLHDSRASCGASRLDVVLHLERGRSFRNRPNSDMYLLGAMNTSTW
jgi:hypothetical protein